MRKSVPPAAAAAAGQPPEEETTQPVLGCLEYKCRGLTIQLTQTWNDFGNISLLRCLASAAVNKTAASDCFEVRRSRPQHRRAMVHAPAL